jgi:hypothetical protein
VVVHCLLKQFSAVCVLTGRAAPLFFLRFLVDVRLGLGNQFKANGQYLRTIAIQGGDESVYGFSSILSSTMITSSSDSISRTNGLTTSQNSFAV